MWGTTMPQDLAINLLQETVGVGAFHELVLILLQMLHDVTCNAFGNMLMKIYHQVTLKSVTATSKKTVSSKTYFDLSKSHES
jgi:hypothetical protein